MEAKVLQIFAGAGGGCLGFQKARTEYRGIEARFRTIGALDSDAGACEALEMITGAKATVCDLFTREQYTLFHGKAPPEGWREMGPSDMLAACGGEAPDVVFTSPPCKGFSGLLSKEKAGAAKYQALNQLVTRALFLVLETWADTPPSLILLENVPRIQQRGRPLLDTLNKMLRGYGYAVSETTHDCGEIGGLGQTRKRFLLVARHIASCSALLYEPQKFPLRSIGEIIGALPAPEAPEGGPMHTLPRLKRETWIRLAMIRAGKDWRDLKERWEPDRWGLVPSPPVEHRSGARFNNVLRLVRWDEPSPAVTGGTQPSSGALSVADPRVADPGWRRGTLGVRPEGEPSTTVTSQARPSTGAFSVADASLGTLSLGEHTGKMRVEDAAGPSHTVTGSDRVGSGALSVADPNLNIEPRNGMLGVMPWGTPAVTVTGSIDVQAGTAAVADPRPGRDGASPFDLEVILSDDGAWHRPLTTLELAALQNFPVTLNGAPLVLPGKSTSNWRMWIGNAVPVATAQAIAEQMLVSLTVSRYFGGFHMGNTGIWVREAGTLRWLERNATETTEARQ